MAYAKKGSEKWIQKKITDWLKTAPGIIYWRQNSGWANMGNRMIRLGDAGLPDIIVILKPYGSVLGLEVKSEKGHLRPKQREFAERLTNAGGIYRVVRSLEQAQDAVAEGIGFYGNVSKGN